MNYRFAELIDAARVQTLTDLFYRATGIPASVIDLDGTIVTGSGWQEICTGFHRVNPSTRQRCTESDTVLANQIATGQKYTLYKCRNGLIDAATPITIEGEHVANFFTGQFLFEQPDLDYFREQARRCGFEEASYMDAVRKIPIMQEARLQPFLEYFSEFAAMLGEMGLERARQIEASARLHRFEAIADNTRDIILFMRRDDGQILEANAAAIKAYGYSREELLSLGIRDIRAAELEPEVVRQMEKADHEGVLFETLHRCKDGTIFPVEVSSRGETIEGIRALVSVIRDITERKKAEAALRESEQRWATTLSSIGDAVIATDNLGRITFLNPMAEELTGWPLFEAVMRPVTEVFNIVNEQTRSTVENPVAKVLKEGMVVGLANHTILIRKDGTEVPIDDSGAPVKDREGNVTGVVLVFRDITERKQADAKILRAKEEWERTFDSVPDLIAIIDKEHRTVRVNEAMARRLGRSVEECVGLRCYETVHALPSPHKSCPHSKTLKDGLEHAEEVHENRLNGDFLVSTTPLHDARGEMIGTVHVAHDITERKAAEEALRRSEEQYRLLFVANPNPMFVFDEETERFLAVNDAAVRHYGWSREEFLEMTVLDIRPAEERTRAQDVIEHTYDSQEVPIGVFRHCRKDGTVMDMEIIVSSIPFMGRRARLCAMNDVTERTLREARIARLTQFYTMLIRVNEAIVRTRDQKLLYDEICRSIAEEGAFPLVWIGEVRQDEVVPVSASGPEVEYMEGIRVEIEGALGRGPTGTSVREDRVVVNEDFGTNGTTEPWRESALARGLRTSAAFPLRREGKAVAALTICAGQPHDFDAEQIELLEALAADVSFALDMTEQERLRTRAESDLHRSLNRFELLAHTAEELLQSPDPQVLVDSLCRGVMEHLGCHAFFNFLALEDAGRLELNAYAGIPREEAEKIKWLDYGVAVCGCAAQDACRIVAEHIPSTLDPRTDLVRSYGIKAYAAHPLLSAEGKVMGTLSFGTRDRETFSEDDLSLMKAVTDQVAIAIARLRDEEALKKARDELEQRVAERTAELRQAYEKLMRETGERAKVEQQLRQAQKMEALGTLSGGIAHDFNNILAAIIGFTELVAGHIEKGSRDERHLARVMQASLRGRELVKQMLTFSRQAEQEKKPLRLSGVVKETVRLLRASIPSTIVIKLSVKSESGVILGDPTQIQQVLMNLTMNAAHAMQEKGGTLAIELSDFSVGPSRPDEHSIAPGLYMKLVVRDTGSGISPDIIDKIFDPFFTTKKLGEGTGLGLSVVHGIVRQSNGYITVESQPGKGSSFSVYFPKFTEKPSAESATDETIPTGSERILFVDDEEALVEMGEDILAELGYEVTSRTSSRQALSLIREEPSRFDLVITDQTMPELTGIDLAREILSVRADIPIIMCTGFSHMVDADKAKAAGIRAFAMKPLTKKEIAKTIRQVLSD
jgi:PAS domain S-box-containing protein